MLSDATPALRIRVGTLTIPVDTLELVDLTPDERSRRIRAQILQLEQERFDPESPLLKYPAGHARGDAEEPARHRDRRCAIACSGRLVGYALGSAIEDHDEEGISSDPRVGENDTFYLQALVVPPSVAERRRTRELPAGHPAPAGDRRPGSSICRRSSKSRVCETAPDWFKAGVTLETLDNYLGSGATFNYLQAPLK